jgi:hypothetical protein
VCSLVAVASVSDPDRLIAKLVEPWSPDAASPAVASAVAPVPASVTFAVADVG